MLPACVLSVVSVGGRWLGVGIHSYLHWHVYIYFCTYVYIISFVCLLCLPLLRLSVSVCLNSLNSFNSFDLVCLIGWLTGSLLGSG